MAPRGHFSWAGTELIPYWLVVLLSVLFSRVHRPDSTIGSRCLLTLVGQMSPHHYFTCNTNCPFPRIAGKLKQVRGSWLHQNIDSVLKLCATSRYSLSWRSVSVSDSWSTNNVPRNIFLHLFLSFVSEDLLCSPDSSSSVLRVRGAMSCLSCSRLWDSPPYGITDLLGESHHSLLAHNVTSPVQWRTERKQVTELLTPKVNFNDCNFLPVNIIMYLPVPSQIRGVSGLTPYLSSHSYLEVWT